MRRFVYLFLAIITLVGCDEGKNAGKPTEESLEKEVTDTTIYGRCGAGTGMSSLELITDEGDTTVYLLEGEDEVADVQGGMFCGDRLAVIAYKGSEGDQIATKVINLTSLIGKWGSLDKSFEILEGGVVSSTMKEPNIYTEWKILNGKLLLSADTFEIYSLGPDSLYLENQRGIYGYKRFLGDRGN